MTSPPRSRSIPWRDLTVWTTAAGRELSGLAIRAARSIGPYPTLTLILLAGFTIAVALTAISVEIYESVVEVDGIAGLDRPVLQAAEALRTPPVNAAVTAFTDLGGPVGMSVLASCAGAGIAIWWRRWTPIVLMAAAATGSLLMTVVGKALVGRIRPPLADAVPPYEHSASFPSGHTLNAVVLVGVVAYLLMLRQRRGTTRVITAGLAAWFALAMGSSRVFLGHHWLTDVLVAWTLGLAWLIIIVMTHRLYLSVRHVRRRG